MNLLKVVFDANEHINLKKVKNTQSQLFSSQTNERFANFHEKVIFNCICFVSTYLYRTKK